MRYSLPFAAALMLGAVAAPAVAADVTIAASNPVVELSITQSVERVPDTITMSAGVTTRAQTASAALRQNSAAMQRVVDQLEQLGVKKDDIQTTGINLDPQFDYDQNTQKQVFRGYQASNRVTVSFDKIDRVGGILDALVQVGATDINGPSFSLADETEAKTEARRKAVQLSHDRAMEYAKFAGYSDVRLLRVSESIQDRSPIASPMVMVTAKRVGAPTAPIRPGTIDIDASVSTTYEMVK